MSGRWLTRFDPRWPVFDRITLACAGLMLVGTVVVCVTEQRAALIGRADAWIATGPPCPRVPAAEAEAFGVASEDFRFDGVRVVRAYGAAICGEITPDRSWRLGRRIPVCRFNSPGKLEVFTRRGAFYFKTGLAPATLTIAQGVPRCALAAKLAPDWRRY